MITLDEAIALARRFHEGAVDKGGRPYIEHPLRVMDRVSTYEEKLAAVLHDLLEDTTLTTADLMVAGCPARVLQALDALTRRGDESYNDFVARAAADPLARVVKRADIDDNLDAERLGQLDPEEAARLRAKYTSARALLDATPTTDPAPSFFSVGEPPTSVIDNGPFVAFDCAVCGHPAGRVELRPAGSAGGDGRLSVVVTSLVGRSISWPNETSAGSVAAAVKSADVRALQRFDLAPFWCPECEKPYCGRHWTTEVVMDEGFYDCTYGTCPHGHRTMIDD